MAVFHPDEPAHRDTAFPDIIAELRAATRAAHTRLEGALDLLQPPLHETRFARILGRFHGFHVIWEPAVQAHPRLASVARERSRLPNLRQDLRNLGHDDAAIRALPACMIAADLARSEATAMGSMYVMEGSILGGQVIMRALADEPWLPAGGLRYFDPYGPRAGAMWRGFTEWCRAQSGELESGPILEGANATFAMLQTWLLA